ncbi:AbrB/MazE/SpoVT family DNA-binding domain-containing protein [Aquibium sp. LZ166]|uniref:AbrB/MazE/SpoVT family DNA-binding domain-containing protein n=1 Tax=Aquibium pacificus TaxID=3153579 RepID=A0ABV3SSQ5_9HYPH
MNEQPRKTAKLFMNGRSQAVRLPAEFRFEGTEVEIRRDPVTGGVLLYQKPKQTGSFAAFFAAVENLRPEDIPDDFMADREQEGQVRDDPLE